ncbi:MAG TPA: DUF1223 domain-containing protein [Thermoanaerobaculia bacterium]
MRHFFFLMVLALFAHEASPSPEAAPVVIELFTSQGCSSCPPADRLLKRLAGDRVIPLSFHVDYWNYIGWTDPFSSKRWSERQQAYARAFRSNRIYTPQLVVSGRTGLNGSDEAGARKRIAEALAAEPAGRVTLAVEPSQDRLKVKVGAKLSRAVEGPLDLWVAVYETGLTTKVGAGENASATLHNDYVVRRLEKALTLPGSAGAADSGEVVLGLDKRWKRERLGVAAFLQDPKTMVIHGAAGKDVKDPKD